MIRKLSPSAGGRCHKGPHSIAGLAAPAPQESQAPLLALGQPDHRCQLGVGPALLPSCEAWHEEDGPRTSLVAAPVFVGLGRLHCNHQRLHHDRRRHLQGSTWRSTLRRMWHINFNSCNALTRHALTAKHPLSISLQSCISLWTLGH